MDGDRLVIGVEAGADTEDLLDIVEVATDSTATIVSVLNGGIVVEFDHPVAPAVLGDAIVQAESMIGVEFVEPDSRRWVTDAPDDPVYSSQWALTSAFGAEPVAGIGIEDAWGVTTGSPDVVVAVIDSGMLPHPDITDRLLPGADLITSPSISNDGDGRDGDKTDSGDTCDGVPSSWHGLHVAGTIGATTDNGLGIAGVDQRASVLPVRVLGTCGGWASDIADAIRWAAGLPVPGLPLNPTPAKVLNLSLGGPGGCSSIEQSAIDAAVGAGAIVVAAAGNSASDLDTIPFSPASATT